jgi:hypothetical protein
MARNTGGGGLNADAREIARAIWRHFKPEHCDGIKK